MSRYDFRKRRHPPEDLSKFITAKKRRLDSEEGSEDRDYSPSASDPNVPKPRKKDQLPDDVVIYDEDDREVSKSREEKESQDSDCISDEEGEDKEESEEGEDKESSEEKESESVRDSDDGPFNPPNAFEDIVDQVTKQVVKKRSVNIDDEDIERYAERESKIASSKLKKVAKKIRDELEAEEPDIVKILTTPMTHRERKRMIQLYEIYKNTMEHTFDHYELRLRLINMLENYSRTDPEEGEKAESESKRIMDTNPKTNVYDIKMRITALNADEAIKAKLLDMFRELDETPSDSSQYRNLKDKLEWAVSLPYNTLSVNDTPQSPEEMNRYCVRLKKALDKEIYGMNAVKEEMIAIRVAQLTNPGIISTIALEGPPGTGKTAIAAAFAKAVGKPFERIALGGMKSADILKGSENQYVGSSPSIILAYMRNMKVADGYILLDEIDKLGDTREGQAVQNALLHITDYTQNKEFRDNFLSEFPHDISKLCFIYGMNDRSKIDPILRDRLSILEVEPYSMAEIKIIIKDYLFPRALAGIGILSSQCSIDESGCDAIITLMSSHIQDTGVRKIEESVRKICSRVNLLRMTTLGDRTTGELKLKYTVPNFSIPFVINKDVVKCLLSPPKMKTVSYVS